MRLAVSNVVPGGVTSLMVIDGNQPARAILDRKDLIVAPQSSPDSQQIVVGVGGFTAFLHFAAGYRMESTVKRSIASSLVATVLLPISAA
jgi:hypothetical protein